METIVALTPSQRRNRAGLALLGGAFGAGLLMGMLDKWVGQPVTLGLWLVVAIASTAGSIVWWRLLDEAQREAHKAAWFWGGSMGMLIGLIGALIVIQGQPQVLMQLNPGADAEGFFHLGVVGLLLSQTAGYLVAWLYWWWSKR